METQTRGKRFGFVIDQRKCIGCHACTVACKSENEVPLGKFRTWVKYVDKGTFPAVRRHFTVLRCNHCDAAPCVDICPVNALHKRKDAIVDLDKDLCIGCRSCMQACPYDAIYLNDDTGTAEKCHYCAHRTELGLEPACVVVCPERAIIAGDLEDPQSGISQILREQPTTQRKLEKGTKPRVWYVDALPEALKPGETNEPTQWLWSDRQVQPPAIPDDLAPPEDILTTLNVDHPPVWGWHIWTYLVTKNIAAGAALAAPLLMWLGVQAGWARDYVPELVALVFLAITLFLLVHDLGRPERFWRVMFAPNTKSWLVRGGWILNGFGAVTTASLVARWLGHDGVADALRWVNVPVAVMTSGYSAFLFAQCKGRDLWLDRWLFAKLILRAAMFGLVLANVLPMDRNEVSAHLVFGAVVFAVSIAFVVITGYLGPTNDEAARAWHAVGVFPWFRRGMHMGGRQVLDVYALWLSFLLVAWNVPLGGLLAVIVVPLVQLHEERQWVVAGQAVPIS